MNATSTHAPVKRDQYSFSLKKIIQDVEERTGRKFSGPEDFLSSSPKRTSSACGPELEGHHHSEPHHPRLTSQLNLMGDAPARPESQPHGDITRGAGRVPAHRSAPHDTGQNPSARRDAVPPGPESVAPPGSCDVGHVSVVLSLLPEIPKLGDEAFLFLYLNISADFERRFGIEGWYNRVLTMAAQGRK
jgi:hypothetical protein